MTPAQKGTKKCPKLAEKQYLPIFLGQVGGGKKNPIIVRGRHNMGAPLSHKTVEF